MISHERRIEKINALPPRRVAEVEDFVDFLSEKDSPTAKSERSRRIAEFAQEFGGTEYDTDPDLEAAGAEVLVRLFGDDEPGANLRRAKQMHQRVILPD